MVLKALHERACVETIAELGGPRQEIELAKLLRQPRRSFDCGGLHRAVTHAEWDLNRQYRDVGVEEGDARS